MLVCAQGLFFAANNVWLYLKERKSVKAAEEKAAAEVKAAKGKAAAEVKAAKEKAAAEVAATTAAAAAAAKEAEDKATAAAAAAAAAAAMATTAAAATREVWRERAQRSRRSWDLVRRRGYSQTTHSRCLCSRR